MRKLIALGIAAAFLSGGIAIGAQQGAAAKKLLVKNPPSGNKKIVYLSKNATGTIQGDPSLNGATFTIALTPGGTQCVNLPAANWSTTNTGFKYKDPQLTNGPVAQATGPLLEGRDLLLELRVLLQHRLVVFGDVVEERVDLVGVEAPQPLDGELLLANVERTDAHRLRPPTRSRWQFGTAPEPGIPSRSKARESRSLGRSRARPENPPAARAPA